jgi:hypothetical protein
VPTDFLHQLEPFIRWRKGHATQKRIALATGRRIIAINLPVVGEAKYTHKHEKG